MQNLSHQTYCFDGFTLDLTRGCLLRGTQEIKLRPKPFEALKYLVENPDRLVSKAELIERIWPDTAVTDDSLVQCLMEVRRALGDDAQQVIKTVPRRGYIFDKPVSKSGPTAQMTTYAEETAGVQVIIEESEEQNSDQDRAEPAFERDADIRTSGFGVQSAEAISLDTHGVLVNRAKPFPTDTGSLWSRLGKIKRGVALALVPLTIGAAGVIYFTRPGEAIDSVAVMPFVNVSGDPNTEYLSEGISDSIIDNLSQLPNLRVIALNSVLRYRGKQTDPQTVGRELSVRAVLMGRLIQQGDSLSISTELVDVRDNKHLWGGQYSRKLADILAMQGEISQDISEKLRLRLTGDEKKRLTRRYTQSGEAYQLYMMGRYFRRRGTKEGTEKAIAYLEQAIKKDPSYAPAYTELGEVYRFVGWRLLLPPKEWRQKEEWAMLRALQIDDALAEAHVLKAHIREIGLDWAGAEEEYKRALELDPNSVRAHETYAWHLEMFGRFDEAMLHLKRARELDPLGLDLMWDMAVLFNFSRQYDRAIEQFQKALEMDPNYVPAHGGLVEAYQKKEMYEEAIAEAKKSNLGKGQLGYAYAVAGKRDEAQKVLDELKVEQSKGYVSPFSFALLYMGLGDKDQAFEWFNKTFEENPYRISFIKVNPRFDSLRSDPRFTDLLRRMKLAP